MGKDQGIQDPFLNTLRRERIPVSMYLVNGIRLAGVVQSFDHYVVQIRGSVGMQAVFKHAISTIVPVRKVPLHAERGGETRGDETEKLPTAAPGSKGPQVTIKRKRGAITHDLS